MEVKITISETPAAGPAQDTTQTSGYTRGAGMAQAGGSPAAAGGGTDTGSAAYGSTQLPSPSSGSSLSPPPDIARAAAALGASNAGPAPMLTGGLFGRSPGEPLAFMAAGSEGAIQAISGAPDQPAGAAPGAEGMAPSEVIPEQPRE